MTAKTHDTPEVFSPGRYRLRRLTRRATAIVCVAALLALLSFADRRLGVFGRARTGDWQQYHGRSFTVVRVIDGDTLDVDCPDGRYPHTRIRLLGVDTSETVKPNTPVQHYGPEAYRYLRELVEGRSVTVELDGRRARDRFNRLLAYLLDGQGANLNERIIATGHGYADPRFPHRLQRRFARTQRAARKAPRGLWKDVTDSDLPYYYRGKLKLAKR